MALSPTDLDALFRHAPDPVVVFDDRFTIVAANGAFFRATGVGRDVVGKDVFQVFPPNPDDPEGMGPSRLRASLERVLATGEADTMPVTRYDLPLGGRDGAGAGFEERHWSPRSYPVLGDGGRVAFIVHQTEDVTELVRLRRRAARGPEADGGGARTEMDRRATAILESITDAFFSVDRGWRFSYVNRQAGRVLGRDPGDLLGRVIWDEFPGLPGSAFEAAYRRAMGEGEASSVTSYYPDHDRWYEVHADPAPDGVSVYFRDVTERKRAEEELRRLTDESERQRRVYEAALSNTPDLVFVFDLGHRFVFANEALLATWGRTRDGALGKTCLELGYEPWHAAMHDREIEQVVATRRPVRGEVPFTGTNGRRVYDYIMVPVTGADGSVVAVAGTTRDVTERREAEEAVRRGEGRLAAALAAADLGTFEWDLRTGAVTLDDRSRAIFGFAPGEGADAGELFSRIDPEDVDRVKAEVRDLREALARLETEYRVRLPDGTARTVLSFNVAVPGPGGEAERMLGVFADVTERERDASVIREQTRVLELIAGGAALRDVLDALCRMVEGHSGNRLLASVLVLDPDGVHLRHGGAPSLPAAYNRAIDGVAIGPRVGSCGTAAYRREPVYVADIAADPLWEGFADLALTHGLRACWSQPILSGGGRVLGTFAMYYTSPRGPAPEDLRLVDIVTRTAAIAIERDRAAEAVRLRTGQFETLLNEAPVGVYLVDAEFRLREVNPAARPTFGDIPGLIGRDFGEVVRLLWPPDLADEIVRLFRHTLETGEPYVAPEVIADRRDRGVTEYYEWQIHRIPLPDGRPGVVCYFRDISAHVRTREALKENDRRKDEFLAMLAHELRNPLAAIANAAQVAKRGDAPEHREWSQGVIESQVTNLSRMIDDLLDVSRITRGKIRLRKVDLGLRPVLLSAVESVRPLVEERKHRLVVDLPDDPLPVHGDPTRLEQVAVNLLNNAAKYTEAGGRVTLSARREGAEVVVSVEDTGVGMSPELLARAFDLFAQGDRSIARSEGGLGIGLTLVKSLVEMHGGRIRAESGGPGRGSRFVVSLPLGRERPANAGWGGRPAEAAGAGEGPPGRVSRVLVVDDNVDTARGMARLLRLLGHDARLAHDGASAIEAAREHLPDVILLDIGLPGKDGYQVARSLRDEGFDRTVIIAVSGYGEETAQLRAREAGFDHHLVKPVDFDSLVALLGRTS